jgi:hypothetical protein
MSDEANQNLDVLNQLDSIDLSTVSTAQPFLPNGIYDVTVAEVKLDKLKEPKVGNLVKIKLTLNNPALDVEGKPVNPGFPIFDQIVITPVGNLTMDMIQTSLARFQEGTIGTKGRFTPLEQYIGQVAQVQVAYDPDSKGKDGQSYGPRNNIKRYIKKKV